MRLLEFLPHAVFPINALPAFRLTGVGIDAASHDASKKFAGAASYYQAVDADLLFCPSDIAIQAEALGARAQHASDRLPAICEPAAALASSAQVSARMRVNAEVVRRLALEFGKPVAGMVYGPFTVAGQVLGEERLLRALLDEPQLARNALGVCLEHALRYAELLIKAGARVLWISDPLAALAPPALYPEYSGRPTAALFEAFPESPSALHVCGDVRHLLQGLLDTGVQGISFDNCLDLLALEDEVPEDVAIIGNLDPVEIMELASAEDVATGAADLAALMAHKENFILSSGCAPPLSTPVVNAAAFVRAGKETLAALAKDLPRLRALAQAVAKGDGESAEREALAGLADGITALDLVRHGLARSIRLFSSRYEARKCYLPEALRAVDAFNQGLAALQSGLAQEQERRPDVILGTVRGDIHEIGKNLARLFLETSGLRVVDLGVNVPAEDFIAAWREHRAPVIGLSVFVTSARRQVAAVTQGLIAAGAQGTRVLVGGAAMSPESARSHGAHAYAPDGVSAARVARRLLAELRSEDASCP